VKSPEIAWRARVARHQLEPRPEEIAHLAVLWTHHVRLRNEPDAKELRQRPRIDAVGLHLGVADRLEILRVAEPGIIGSLALFARLS
jgi:hypothetical protein